MINNELLAKMLDGTLTDSERMILTKESAINPELANEVAQLQRIDAILAKSGYQYDAPTPAFLKSVEDEIAQRVKDSRKVKPVPFIPPIFDTKFNWNIFIMACSGIVTISSLGYLGYNKLFRVDSINPITLEHSLTSEPISISQTSPHISSETSTTKFYSNQQKTEIKNNNKQNVQLTDNLGASDNIDNKQKMNLTQPNQTKDFSKNELDASIAASSGANTPIVDIQNKLNQLTEKRTQGNKIAEMSLNKQIGLLYNQEGNPTEAKKYLDEALRLAQNTSIKEEEATILGELGLIDNKLGYSDKAIIKIRQAIEILNSTGNNTSRWTKELSTLQK